MLLVNVLAQCHKHDLRNHGVSLISVEGLNFDCFMPLFGENAIPIRVSVITDADPSTTVDEKTVALYPAAFDNVDPSDTTKSMLRLQDDLVRVFHGQKHLNMILP
ncbi:ATP-dependent endonuclease [Komagataeibacter rhaeticus]|nr:ATP-dependent endonuclease [Komagataeibacter rhaeticus]